MEVQRVKGIAKENGNAVQPATVGLPIVTNGRAKIATMHPKCTNESSRLDAFTTAVLRYL